MSRAEEAERPSYEVREADESKQDRRITEVLDARVMVMRVSQRLFEDQAAGEIGQDGRNIGIQVAMKSFIRECLNLLPQGEIDVPENVPHPFEAELGEVPMNWHQNIKIVGLKEYLKTDETYPETWYRPKEPRHGPATKVEHHTSHTVPKELSWNAYEVLWKYLNWEYDIDVQFEAGEEDVQGGVL